MSENTPDGGAVIVSLKDLYTEMVHLIGEVRSLTDSVRVLTESSKSIHADHELRLRALEKWRYAIPSTLLLALASIATTVTTIILHR